MPPPPRLRLTDLGPIRSADVRFGDLTVFVGAQATGKSIALQMLKYSVDNDRIVEEMDLYGLDWAEQPREFWNLFLGEGMVSAIEGAKASWSERVPSFLTPPRASRKREPRPLAEGEKVFYIPAQRVLTMLDGWPRPFRGYNTGDPYVVKAFSERARMFLDQGMWASSEKALFPQTGRLKGALRDIVRDAVFHDFELAVDTSTLQRRLVLRHGGVELPYMVWSAGQREFVPLLVGLYWLLPPTKTSRRGQVEWVILEEPEMGLHPRAILAVMLLVIDLMDRGYRVVLSTHSAQVLDFVWAIREMRETTPDPKLLLRAVGAEPTPRLIQVVKSAFQKSYQTYAFGLDGVVRDISDLNPGSDDETEAGWGGLSEFSGTLADAVAEAVQRAERP